MANEVLIYTTKGNVPESTLNYTQEWEDHIDCEITLVVEDGQFKPVVNKTGYMIFKEFYHDKETNELVKENRHICLMRGQKADNEQGSFG
jgi:aminopeptidase-like protein